MRAQVNKLTGNTIKGAHKIPSPLPRRPAANPAATSYAILENDKEELEEQFKDLNKRVETLTQQKYHLRVVYVQATENVKQLENDGLNSCKGIDRLLELQAAVPIPRLADKTEKVSFNSNSVLRNYEILAGKET
jgi:hypothetical protein